MLKILKNILKIMVLILMNEKLSEYTLDEINVALDDLNNSNVFRPLIVIDETLK